jgi:hypothetical protein
MHLLTHPLTFTYVPYNSHPLSVSLFMSLPQEYEETKREFTKLKNKRDTIVYARAKY